MCGIVGYTGFQNAKNIVIDGLRTLEYRGYDSAGVAFGGEKIGVFKTAGRVHALEAMLPDGVFHCGIGHTRWATHGKPNAVNAHPHLSFDGRIAVVHNGVLNDADELVAQLKNRGVERVSETDSELIAHLLALEGGDMLDAVRRVGDRLSGSATFLAISAGDEAIYVYRKGASMAIAHGEGESFAASDTLALARYCRRAIVLEDGEYARLTCEGCTVFKDGARVLKQPVFIHRAPPRECACHMRAEIDEIPAALERTYLSVTAALNDELISRLNRANRLVLSGCGTAFHACRYGKMLAERTLKVPAEAIAASEMDGAELVDENSFAIFITQSGETADTILAMRSCKQKGAFTLAITNVDGSSASFAADKTLSLDAGAEVAVAATKSYNCQLLALYLLFSLASGRSMSKEELFRLTAASEKCLSLEELYEKRALAAKVFFVGRGQDLITAKEGALKLKEITYHSAEAYAAGELKHGPIALVDAQSFVIAIATKQEYLPRMRATVSELRARGAYTVGVSSVGDLGANKTLQLPKLDVAELQPLLAVLPLQNFALSASLCLGLNPDKPRNLAKSVTVI